jgi:hypothetical protein
MSCTVCNHPQRQAIDLALLNRTATLARLSEQHHLSTSALHRHKQHLLQKLAQAQNRFQDILREGYLFILNEFLEMVHRAAQTASAEGNSRQLLQAVRQGTNIIKFMAKLDDSLSADTVHRLLASTEWAEPGKLLPTDPQFVVGCHQALAHSLSAPCPEPSDQAQALAAGQMDEADLAELADLHPELLQELIAGLNQSLDACGCEPYPAKREKGGKKPGNTPPRKDYSMKFQLDKESQGYSAISPGHPHGTRNVELETPLLGSGNWIEDLDAGRLNIDFLNAIGVGRQPLEAGAISRVSGAKALCP